MVYQFLNELKEIIYESFKEWLKKVKYVFIILVILFCVFSICFFKTTDDNITILGIGLENWEKWITIITIPITAIWAVHQYNKNMLLRKQEKAAKIAKLFSEELMDKCSLIENVIENSELKQILKLNRIDMIKLKRFDREEINELYNPQNHDAKENFFSLYQKAFRGENVQLTYFYFLEKRISNKTWDQIILNSSKEKEKRVIEILEKCYSKEEIESLKNKKLLFNEFEKYCKENDCEEKIDYAYRKKYTDESARELFILNNQDLPFKFTKLVSDVLNELEYICMYISSQSAGSKFVYQSLHQMFIRTIKSLAVNISMPNKNYSDKYYTNIIYVYKEWSRLEEIGRRKEEKNKRKAYKYLEPKIKTV